MRLCIESLTKITFCLFFVSCFSLESQIKNGGWPAIRRECKPGVRWWWMGNAVDEKGISYNLSQFGKAGLGTVEITPIYGVKGQEEKDIEYLSPEWMKILSFTEKKADSLGINVEMNMGSGWPFGGPRVSLKEAAAKAVFQEYDILKGENFTDSIVVSDPKQKHVAYLDKLMGYSDHNDILDFTDSVKIGGKLNWRPDPNKNWHLIALFVGKTFQRVKRAAPGGEGYVMDHFDKNAVSDYFTGFDRAFKNNGVKFPHCFFNDSYEVYGADWTPSLLKEFEKRRGYKLEDHFPEFLRMGKDEASLRIVADYRETIGDILKENFTLLWTNLSHEKGVITRNQAHGSPANIIDLYAAVDIPECETFGITDFDLPYLRKDSLRKENDGDPATLKYASSAAHISGKRYTSAETFTWLTEHFRTSLSQCKPEIDQMFVAGVNHVYFHGAAYSPPQAPWPGWKFYASIDMSPTDPMWRDAPAFFKYVSRVQSFLQKGEPDNDFLLYFPICDFWANQRGDNFLTFAIHGLREKLPEFYNIVSEIKERGYDLDYITDEFIKSCKVSGGLIETKGGTKYKALILPSVKYIPIATLHKIIRLCEEGAAVVFTDRYPDCAPGFNDYQNRNDSIKNMIDTFSSINSFGKVQKYRYGKGWIITGKITGGIFKVYPISAESVKSLFGCEYIRRKDPDGYHYFVAMLKNKTIDGWVPFSVKVKSAMIYDPITGRTGKASVRNNRGISEIYLQLKPGESLIVKTYTRDDIKSGKWTYYKNGAVGPMRIDKGWQLKFIKSEPAIKEVFKINRLKSWTDLPDENLKINRGTASYKVSFTMKKSNECEYLLHLGDVRESAEIYINGNCVDTVFSVPFETKIGKYLKSGKNIMEIWVTNLPANRISDYDRRGINWRIFEDINMVNIDYKKDLYDKWGLVPSGLLGPVSIDAIVPYYPK